MSSRDVVIGGRRVSHRTIRLLLVLLPVWVIGVGEFSRFIGNNATAGAVEANGLIKGRDFIQFYVAGALARDDKWRELYDVPALQQEVARLVPAAAGNVPAPVYGPQVALFFSPWSRLPYIAARWCWFVWSAVIYFAAAALVIHTTAHLKGFRVIAGVTLLCNPALAMVLTTGQTGAMGMLFWALAIVAAGRGRRLLFGLCLGLLAYKPPLLIGTLPALVILRCWPALVGILITGGGQLAVSAIIAGVDPWRHYINGLISVSRYYFLTDTIPHQKQSILGFFQVLVGSNIAALALTAVAVVAILAMWWFHRDEWHPTWVAAMLSATAVLLSPHFYVYDLIVLTPALLVIADRLAWRCSSPAERTVLVAAYSLLLAPVSGFLALRSGIQLSTVLLTWFAFAVHQQWLTSRASRESLTESP
jgi:Glycosyltransferase family 87